MKDVIMLNKLHFASTCVAIIILIFVISHYSAAVKRLENQVNTFHIDNEIERQLSEQRQENYQRYKLETLKQEIQDFLDQYAEYIRNGEDEKGLAMRDVDYFQCLMDTDTGKMIIIKKTEKEYLDAIKMSKEQFDSFEHKRYQIILKQVLKIDENLIAVETEDFSTLILNGEQKDFYTVIKRIFVRGKDGLRLKEEIY